MPEPVTIEQQIAEVAREIALRRNVYPGWVARGKMKQERADYHMAVMVEVHRTLVQLRDGNRYRDFQSRKDNEAAPRDPWAFGRDVG